MSQPCLIDKSLCLLYELGRLTERGTVQKLIEQLSELSTQHESPTIAEFFRIGSAFSLDTAEQLIFANCLWHYADGKAYPQRVWMTEFRTAFNPEAEHRELSFLLNPQSHELLDNACAMLSGRTTGLPAYAQLQAGGKDCYHSQSLLEEMDTFLTRCTANEGLLPAVVALSGESGSGRRFLLAELAHRRDCLLLLVDAAEAVPTNAPLIAGMALLYDAMIALTDYSDTSEKLLTELFGYFSVLFVTTSGIAGYSYTGCRTIFARSVQPLTAQERLAAIHSLFPTLCEDEQIRAADTYRMNPSKLMRAAAHMRAETNKPSLMRLLQQENAAYLANSAQLLQTNKRLADLVLPADAKQQIARLCDFVGVRTTVWKQWGFENKIPYGRGIAALFYGASGTGKTLAAGIVANELGMPLYRVDISQLISKYIGETQKNIGQIFDNAKNVDCILFFDEADALFARRGESSDAQDRYANAETAYLLQRTEQYDGIILLATNLLQNFDEAFRRRIDFMIHFPLPDIALREQLWRGIFPKEAPIGELNFELLAEQLELSGAGIRNCALTAAYLAAAEHREIDMACVAEAARGEYQKQGKAFPGRLSIFLPPERRP